MLRNGFKCKPFSWCYGLKSIQRILHWISFGKCYGYIELNWKWNNWKSFNSFNWKLLIVFYFVCVSGKSTKWQSRCNANEWMRFEERLNEEKQKKRGKLRSVCSDKVSRLLTFCGVFGWRYKIERERERTDRYWLKIICGNVSISFAMWNWNSFPRISLLFLLNALQANTKNRIKNRKKSVRETESTFLCCSLSRFQLKWWNVRAKAKIMFPLRTNKHTHKHREENRTKETSKKTECSEVFSCTHWQTIYKTEEKQ